MNRCLITYEPINSGFYSSKGLSLLAPGLKDLKNLNYDSFQLRRESCERAAKMSIAGVQPKVSAVFSKKDEAFSLVDVGGKFIIKPQIDIYDEVPENEDLTMRMAKLVGIEVPLHGLLLTHNGEKVYFIKRFDRYGHKGRKHVEDFAQLLGKNRNTKYNISMEKTVSVIEDYCTFPAKEKAEYFKRMIFNFLVGNEDMHLKNFSLIVENNIVRLAPAYDFLNSTIVIKRSKEEIALPVAGKKNNLTRKILVDYYARQRLELPNKIVDKTLRVFVEKKDLMFDYLLKSFMSDNMKEKYRSLMEERFSRLFGGC